MLFGLGKGDLKYTFQVDGRGLSSYRFGLSQCRLPRGQPTLLPSAFPLPRVLVKSKCEFTLIFKVRKSLVSSKFNILGDMEG